MAENVTKAGHNGFDPDKAKAFVSRIESLKAVIKVRALEKKAERARDDLDNEVQGDFDNLRLALGDLAETPLGEAAQKAAA